MHRLRICGSVGIGTASPVSMLEVNGSIRFTGASATAARINTEVIQETINKTEQ